MPRVCSSTNLLATSIQTRIPHDSSLGSHRVRVPAISLSALQPRSLQIGYIPSETLQLPPCSIVPQRWPRLAYQRQTVPVPVQVPALISLHSALVLRALEPQAFHYCKPPQHP